LRAWHAHGRLVIAEGLLHVGGLAQVATRVRGRRGQPR